MRDPDLIKRITTNALSDLRGAIHLGYWSDVQYVIDKLSETLEEKSDEKQRPTTIALESPKG